MAYVRFMAPNVWAGDLGPSCRTENPDVTWVANSYMSMIVIDVNKTRWVRSHPGPYFKWWGDEDFLQPVEEN